MADDSEQINLEEVYNKHLEEVVHQRAEYPKKIVKINDKIAEMEKVLLKREMSKPTIPPQKAERKHGRITTEIMTRELNDVSSQFDRYVVRHEKLIARLVKLSKVIDQIENDPMLMVVRDPLPSKDA